MAYNSMNTQKNKPLHLTFSYDTGADVPPPHYHQYKLELKESNNGLFASYQVAYLHREDLTEEEIIEEGFTLDDDWSAEEELPQIWLQALKDQLTDFPIDQPFVNGKASSVNLQVTDLGGNSNYTGEVSTLDEWVYFLQELVQAILETGNQEMPFVLNYIEVENKHIHKEIELEASFEHRKITVSSRKADKVKRSKAVEWERLPEIMQQVYLPEYDYDKAIAELPKRSGTYLSTGEGLWFEWGKSLTEPKGETSSLLRLKSMIKQLAAKEENL
jgi:hypothetical protein